MQRGNVTVLFVRGPPRTHNSHKQAISTKFHKDAYQVLWIEFLSPPLPAAPPSPTQDTSKLSPQYSEYNLIFGNKVIAEVISMQYADEVISEQGRSVIDNDWHL